MVDVEKINKLPIDKLLTYYQSLKQICIKYKEDLVPLYNSQDRNDQRRWIETNHNLQYSNMYFDAVFEALKTKVFTELDTLGQEKEKKITKSTKKTNAKVS